MNPENKIKILVIRLSSLGDVLLTTPVLRALKNKFPSSKIHFLVKPQFTDAVRSNPNISKIIEYDTSNIFETKRNLKSQNFKIILDLQNNFRSRQITRFVHSKKYRFKKPSLKKWLLVKFKINFLKDYKKIPQRYAESMEGLQLDSNGLELYIPNNIKPVLDDSKNYIGFCPGSQHRTKRWPKNYFIELGNMLVKNDFKVVLFGGKNDRILCEEISNAIAGSINLQNEDNLLQIAADMKKCKVVVSNDSGLMHVATAMDVWVLAIFGSSVKEFGFTPYGIKNLILENNSLHCRPCSHIGKGECPKNHFKCMNDITAQMVFNKIKNII